MTDTVTLPREVVEHAFDALGTGRIMEQDKWLTDAIRKGTP